MTRMAIGLLSLFGYRLVETWAIYDAIDQQMLFCERMINAISSAVEWTMNVQLPGSTYPQTPGSTLNVSPVSTLESS